MTTTPQQVPRPAPAPMRGLTSEPKKDYRGLPPLAFLRAVVKRQAAFVIIGCLIYAPFALFATLGATKTYESTLLLRYDPGDTLDSDPALLAKTGFPAATSMLTDYAKDGEFYRQIAKQYNMPAGGGIMSRLQGIKGIGKYVAPKESGANTADLDARAKALKDRVVLASDYDLAMSYQMRLSALGYSPEDAQKLATIAGQVLIQSYYAAQTSKAEAGRLSLATIINNDRVKALAEKAANAEDAKSPTKSRDLDRKTAIKQDMVTVKQRQQLVLDRIKEINLRIASTRERRSKLQSEIEDLAQRYGAFHPRIQALQKQLADVNGSDNNPALKGELKTLEDQSVDLEAEASILGLPVEVIDGVDKVVKHLSNKLDRYDLELINLENQTKDPDQRTRLAIFSGPSAPLEALRSNKAKLVAGAAAGFLLIILLALAREVFNSQARDPWRITWRFQLPCLGVFSRSLIKRSPSLLPQTIKDLRLNLLRPGSKDKQAAKTAAKGSEYLLASRKFTHWMHNQAAGNVILFVKGSATAKSAPLLSDLFNVYCSDYSGRCLVVDFDTRDAIGERLSVHASGDILDFLAETKAWKSVCRRTDNERAFDLVPAPQRADDRLPQLIDSIRFKALLDLASKTYQTVLIVGLGPDQFVENSSLLAYASDCVVVVEQGQTTFSQLDQLIGHLSAAKVSGFLQVSS